MSQANSGTREPVTKLLPHQRALVETAFNSPKRVVLLRAEVGLGKTVALVALASRLLQDRPRARALFLVPAAMRYQIMEMLHSSNTPALLVDRYVFREMLDSTIDGDLWRSGEVMVMSLDFAKQPDIRDSLAQAHWGLVIADEAHLVQGTRAEALRAARASADRVVLATATPSALGWPEGFSEDDATVVEWHRDQVVDDHGKPLLVALRPVLHEVTFSLSPAELELRDSIRGLCEILRGGASVETWKPVLLLRCLESSPAALEGALQKLAGGAELGDLEERSESLEETIPSDLRVDPSDHIVRGIAARALQQIEAIGSDSKLNALKALLSEINQSNDPSHRTCVLTEFASTLYYVSAEVEGHGRPWRLMHGQMRAEERIRSLELFSTAGGILVGTTAIMRAGVDLPDVADLVLYDVPHNKVTLQQVLGRFDRFGRRIQLNVYVLSPSNARDGFSFESLGLLHDTLSSRAAEGTET